MALTLPAGNNCSQERKTFAINMASPLLSPSTVNVLSRIQLQSDKHLNRGMANPEPGKLKSFSIWLSSIISSRSSDNPSVASVRVSFGLAAEVVANWIEGAHSWLSYNEATIVLIDLTQKPIGQ